MLRKKYYIGNLTLILMSRTTCRW